MAGDMRLRAVLSGRLSFHRLFHLRLKTSRIARNTHANRRSVFMTGRPDDTAAAQRPVAAGGVHRSETFRDAEIRVDGRTFESCRFERCRLVYAGGATPVINGCRFTDCAWSFSNGAADTLAMLAGLYQGGFAPMVEATLDAVRRGAVASAPPARTGEQSPQRMIDLGFGRFPVPRVVVRGSGRA